MRTDHTVSVVLLSVWLMLFGAIQTTWISMTVHNFGVVTFIVGLAILLIEFFFYGNEKHWFRA